MQRTLCILTLISLAFCLGCKDPFIPDIPFQQSNLLVVEGYINMGAVPTVIGISRISGLDEGTLRRYERGANVRIEDESGSIFILTEKDPGTYVSADLDLPQDRAYRIVIKTVDGASYHSAFVKTKVTPPIDSVSWQWEKHGLQIYVNSHDPENLSRYYQWTYEEDWELKSQEATPLKYEGDTLVNLSQQEAMEMRRCWKSSVSEDLIIASSANLSHDLVHFPLISIAHISEKTGVKYSVLVKQHALSKENYEYLKLIQKNSTQMGSFFDAMPSDIHGNIQNIDNAEEKVIGFVDAYTTVQSRLYIRYFELPSLPTSPAICQMVDLANQPDSLRMFFGEGAPYLPLSTYFDRFGNARVVGIEAFCVDCRLRGVSIPPDFWE
jgi:hypothetical protein